MTVLVQQGAEHRIAVQPGEAGPQDRAQRVHQRSDGAIADHAEFEISISHFTLARWQT